MPRKLVEIGEGAFFACTNLTSVATSPGIKVVARRAFFACANLPAVALPPGIVKIGNEAFDPRTTVLAPTNSSVHEAAKKAKCETFEIGGTYVDSGVVLYWGVRKGKVVVKGAFGKAKTLVVPDKIDDLPVTEIGKTAFRGCEGLNSVTLPQGITKIGNGAFDSKTMIVAPSGSKTQKAAQKAGYETVEQGGVYSSPGMELHWENRNGKVVLLRAEGQAKTMIVPDEIDGLPVTEIEDHAFCGLTSLTSITLPLGITRIGKSAFGNCASLTAITTPQETTRIEKWTFSGCTNLTSVTLSQKITEIGEGAFRGCASLTSIALPQRTTKIEKWAFSDCVNLRSITLPQGTAEIEKEAFSSRIRLVAPANSSAREAAQRAGYETFESEGVSTVSGTTFRWGKKNGGSVVTGIVGKAKTLIIPDELDGAPVTEIGDYAFYNSEELTSIVLPSGIAKIGGHAFHGCVGLKSIAAPKGVVEIGAGAFNGCASLTSIALPERVAIIRDMTFFNCAGLKSIALSPSLVEIGNSAFCGCASLTSIQLPPELSTIGSDAFHSCTSLTSIELPEGISRIPEGSFRNCENLTSITTPQKLAEIGNAAFSGCKRLTSITLPQGLAKIGRYAFDGCASLTSITLPEGLAEMGYFVFHDCTGLRSVTLPQDMTEIVLGTFDGCASLTSITPPRGITLVNSAAFRNCKSLTSITLPPETKVVGDQTFNGCASLTSINLPEGITTIGTEAFSGCHSLTSITLPAGLEILGAGPFASRTVVVAPPNSNAQRLAREHGYEAFESCGTYACPDMEIHWGKIDGRVVLKNASGHASTLVVPAEIDGLPVTEIGRYAFENCTSLTSITLPEGITKIGDDVFPEKATVWAPLQSVTMKTFRAAGYRSRPPEG